MWRLPLCPQGQDIGATSGQWKPPDRGNAPYQSSSPPVERRNIPLIEMAADRIVGLIDAISMRGISPIPAVIRKNT